MWWWQGFARWICLETECCGRSGRKGREVVAAQAMAMIVVICFGKFTNGRVIGGRGGGCW